MQEKSFYYAEPIFNRYSAREDIFVVGERRIIDPDPERVWFVVRNKELNQTAENYILKEKEKFGDITVHLFTKLEQSQP